MLGLSIFLYGCRSKGVALAEKASENTYDFPDSELAMFLLSAPKPDGFDFPLCKPNGRGCYDAQPFGIEGHLGEDWNIGPNNRDLGQPIFSTGAGIVVFSRDVGGGWGNVLRVIHRLPPGSSYEYVEVLYAHFQKLIPKVGDILYRGMKIGTIGTAGGLYEAHLHLEIRSKIGLPIGGGYSEQPEGFLEPKKFINNNRPMGNSR